VCVLHAQQQEPKLEERLLYTPNSSLAYAPEKGAFLSGKTFNAGKAYVKDYEYDQKVQTKAFSAKDFSGAKGYWAGNFKLSDSKTPVQDAFVLSSMSKTYATKAEDVKNARESGETSPTRGYAGNVQFKGRYEDQTELATNAKAKPKSAAWRQEQEKTKSPLSIDEVRDLLNKNK